MIIVEVLGILQIIPLLGDLSLSDPKRGGAEFGPDSDWSQNYDIIYSFPKTETITWFICFNQCIGLFFFFLQKLYFYLFNISFLLFYFYYILLLLLFFVYFYGKVVTSGLMQCWTY